MYKYYPRFSEINKNSSYLNQFPVSYMIACQTYVVKIAFFEKNSNILQAGTVEGKENDDMLIKIMHALIIMKY